MIAHYLGSRPHLHGVLLELQTTEGTLTGLTVELHRGSRVIASAQVARATCSGRRVVLRARGKVPPAGRYVLVVRQGRTRLLRQALRVS